MEGVFVLEEVLLVLEEVFGVGVMTGSGEVGGMESLLRLPAELLRPNCASLEERD